MNDKLIQAAELILRLAAHGVTVRVSAGGVFVTPKAKVTPVMAARLKQYKPQILELDGEYLAEAEAEREAIEAQR